MVETLKILAPVLMAALFMQGGFLIWKILANRESVPATKFFFFSPLWWLGFLSTAVGWMLFVKAADLMDITLVQPVMSAADILLAVLLSVLWLGERLHRWEWAGVVIIFFGACIVSFQAEFRRPEVIQWFALGVVFVVLILAGSGGLFYSTQSKFKEIPHSLSIATVFCGAAILTKLLTAKLFFSGKPLGFGSIVFDPALAGVLVLNGLGIGLLMRAFKHGRSAIIIPVQLALTNALVFVAATYIFNERLTVSRMAGLFFILAGTTLLHGYSSRQEKFE